MLILASNSPRRRQLLALGGWDFMVMPAQVDESVRPGESPSTYVLRTAEQKARACYQGLRSDQLALGVIIALDTAVVDEQDILGKPADAEQAKAMLRRLRGHAHQVYSGLVVLRACDGKILRDICITQVPMRHYSEDELLAYVESGDPLDKAGAYAIQHEQFRPVQALQGCYANVMGLPLCHLTRTLALLGIRPEKDIAGECQDDNLYLCPIFDQVLQGVL